MRIIAKLDRNHHARLVAYFWCSQFENPKALVFFVDSGCTTTTILNDDATLLGINCALLDPANCQVSTANGDIIPYEIPDAILIFRAEYGFLNLKKGLKGTQLSKVHFHPPTNPLLLTPQRIHNSFSLLGMDFLTKFKKWRFTDTELILSTT